MPIFEFECRSCGHAFEQLVLPGRPETAEKPSCPACQATNTERTLSICAISSESTRQSALQKARKRNQSVVVEKEREEFKELVEHANEHH